MDTQILKIRIKHISDFVKAIDNAVEPMNFYPKHCMKTLMEWIDEVREMVDEEENEHLPTD